uniref:cell death regulator Aven-like isoform X2 n=1 Tax=Styela clava TaxID=7725 RepID=UPI0019399514|nr:cell death regulator Aven-like isoform X2 [Styela clava]
MRNNCSFCSRSDRCLSRLCCVWVHIFYIIEILNMRPDEHKKTKNARYKKKHGIQQGQSSVSDDKDNERSNITETQAKLPAFGDNEVPISESGFSKRPITSNWAKYESAECDENDQGTDFNVLLSFAGDTSPRMKLKHEEEWDSVQATLMQFLSSMDESDLTSKEYCLQNRAILSSTETQEMGFNFSKKNINQGPTNPTGCIEPSLKEDGREETNKNPILCNSNDENTLLKNNEHSCIPECSSHSEEDFHTIDELIQSTQKSLQAEKISTFQQQTCDNSLSKTASIAAIDQVPSESAELQPSEPKGEEKSNNVDDLEDWLDSIL